jgi:dolichol kinase
MSRKSLRKEMLRKFFHFMEVPVLIGYTLIRHYFNERLATLAITVLFLILLEIEYVRLEHNFQIPEIFTTLLRKKEQNNVTGTIFFIAATIIVFAAFDYPIAVTALLLTVFGDFAAAVIGIKFGKRHLYKDKTLEGTLAGFTMNCFIGYLFLPEYPMIFLPMAFVATLVELLTGKLDDNLTVPLFSAFTGQMIAYLMQAPLTTFPGPAVGSIFNFFVNFR